MHCLQGAGNGASPVVGVVTATGICSCIWTAAGAAGSGGGPARPVFKLGLEPYSSTGSSTFGLVLPQETAAASKEGPELLDPVSDLKVNAFELVGDIRQQQLFLVQRAAMPAHWWVVIALPVKSDSTAVQINRLGLCIRH